MYIICTQRETPVFMRDSRKMPKIDVICSFFVLRSADFLMYIICTRHFFDFSILIFCIFHFLLFDFFKNLKIHFLNFPELNFSDFRFSIFSNFKKHNFYRKKFRGREKTIFASSSSTMDSKYTILTASSVDLARGLARLKLPAASRCGSFRLCGTRRICPGRFSGGCRESYAPLIPAFSPSVRDIY